MDEARDHDDAHTLGGHRLRVEPLTRELLEGVPDPSDSSEPSGMGAQARSRVDLGLVPWFLDERPLQGLAGLIDWRLSGRLSSMLRSGWCAGRAGESVLLPLEPGLPVRRLLLVGLGRRAEFEGAEIGRRIQGMVEKTLALRPESILFALPDVSGDRGRAEEVFSALLQAIEASSRSGEKTTEEPEESDEEPADSASPLEPGVEPDEAGAEPVSEDRASDEEDSSDDERETGRAHNGTLSGVDDPEPPHRLPPVPAWWVVAEPSHVSRLRRVLQGPPRPATQTAP